MGGGDAMMMAMMTGVQAISQIGGGVSANSAAKREASLLDEQAYIYEQDAHNAAIQKAREVTRFQQRQGKQYIDSGVTIGTQGYKSTPVLMLEETRRLGQQEVDALYKRGEELKRLTLAKAGIMRNQGRSAMWGGLLGAAGTAAQGYLMGKRLGVYGDTTKDVSALAPAAPSGTVGDFYDWTAGTA